MIFLVFGKKFSIFDLFLTLHAMKDLTHLICKRIKLIHMGNDPLTGKPDPDPIPDGTEGKVISVSGDMLMMEWDNGRGLNLIDGVDTYEVL